MQEQMRSKFVFTSKKFLAFVLLLFTVRMCISRRSMHSVYICSYACMFRSPLHPRVTWIVLHTATAAAMVIFPLEMGTRLPL